MSSEPWNLGSEKSNATLQLRQDYIYDALNEHLIGSGIVDATTFAAFASYLGYSSGGSGQDMQVAWTPTNLKLGEAIFGITFPVVNTLTGLTFEQSTFSQSLNIPTNEPALTQIAFPNLASLPNSVDIIIANQLSLTTVAFPLLSTSGAGCHLSVTGNTSLSSISLPLLSFMDAINISSNGITTLSLPSLTQVGGQFSAFLNTSLTSISCPSLTQLNGNVDFDGCTNLTTVDLGSVVFSVGGGALDVDIDSCALTAASVNHILARLVASPSFTGAGCTVELNGGTNAAPSGQGVADKATLIGRGCAVLTN